MTTTFDHGASHITVNLIPCHECIRNNIQINKEIFTKTMQLVATDCDLGHQIFPCWKKCDMFFLFKTSPLNPKSRGYYLVQFSYSPKIWPVLTNSKRVIVLWPPPRKRGLVGEAYGLRYALHPFLHW
jgi:hypothetical protein